MKKSLIKYNKHKCITYTLVICMFLLSYSYAIKNANAVSESSVTVVYSGNTALTTTGAAGCPKYSNSRPCMTTGTSVLIAGEMQLILYEALVASSQIFEKAVNKMLAITVNMWLAKLRLIETRLAKDWTATWNASILPGLKKMSTQIAVMTVDSNRKNQSFFDARDMAETITEKELQIAKSKLDHSGSEIAAISSTMAKGSSKGNSFSRAARNAINKNNINIGINKMGNFGSHSAIAFEGRRNKEYKNTFCDPSDSSGRNKCGDTDPNFYNADTRPTKYIYNTLTIPINPDVDDKGHMEKTLNHLGLNLFGSPAMNPLPKSEIVSNTGQAKFLDRRSYVARHSAVRSVQNLIAGWRIPGSKIGSELGELRKASQIPEEQISTNPSYKEIMHALTVDRFNSGHYARDLISTPANIEMEKLVLDTLYLTQLRDYYELLERTALVLALQIILTTEEMATPETIGSSRTQ